MDSALSGLAEGGHLKFLIHMLDLLDLCVIVFIPLSLLEHLARFC